MKRLASLVAGAVMLCGAANAQLVEEARIGVVQHNICVLDCDNADKEDGPNINGELVFKSPDVLSIVWSPRPYVMASYNTAGNTNFGGVGLQWDFEFGDGWAIEPGIGYVFHDGANSSPFPQGDPRGSAPASPSPKTLETVGAFSSCTNTSATAKSWAMVAIRASTISVSGQSIALVDRA